MFEISPIRKYTYEYTKRTPSPRKYRCYTSWYPHGSHVCSESRQCDKTRSLSRTCSRRVCLSSFVYTFVGSVVSLAAGGILFLPFSFALPPVVSAVSVCVALPHRRGRAFLSSPQPPQAPSSSYDRCPARLERVRWRSYRFVSASLLRSSLREKRNNATRLALSYATRPCRPLPTTQYVY